MGNRSTSSQMLSWREKGAFGGKVPLNVLSVQWNSEFTRISLKQPGRKSIQCLESGDNGKRKLIVQHPLELIYQTQLMLLFLLNALFLFYFNEH